MSKKCVIKNSLITLGILFLAGALCLFLQRFSEADTHVPLVFVLAILFISRFTDGYAYGIVASVFCVMGVNYIFTYPYFAFNFTLTGYSLTFVVMLTVSWCVSALTTQIKKQEKVRLEIEKEKMRGNLLRAVSHDIRTPLTAISGAASALMENYKYLTEEDVLELVRNMKEESQWLIQIVENLLSITRMENGSGTEKLSTEEELVEEIVGSAVLKFKKRHPDLELSVELPDDILLVPMDGILIEQVMSNLLENSVQHGKFTSQIRIHIVDEPERAVIVVEDNGAGIRKEVLPRIFDGNLQSDSGEENDSARNMGIGLSVCMSIVKAHKGGMKAENKKEGGARVIFWLPKAKTEEEVWK